MISSHVLDTARGVPAAGVPVLLERLEPDEIHQISRATTDGDGRVRELVLQEGLGERNQNGAAGSIVATECGRPVGGNPVALSLGF